MIAPHFEIKKNKAAEFAAYSKYNSEKISGPRVLKIKRQPKMLSFRLKNMERMQRSIILANPVEGIGFALRW